MGKKPAEIQHEIERKRAAIGSHIEDVQHRVRDDVTTLKHSAENQASQTVGQTKSKLDFSAQTQEHPLSMLTGALGLGVILGAASEGLPGNGKSRSNDNGRRPGAHFEPSSSQNNNGGGGMLGNLMSSFISPAGETVRDELRELVKDGFAAFKNNSGLDQSQNRGEAPPPR